MPIALTIDQRHSRSDEDLVDRWVRELNKEFAPVLELPFVSVVGDELQGLTGYPAPAVELVLRGVRFRHWWVGIGLGEVESPLKDTAARSRGSAFYRARQAVELAKSRRPGFAVVGAGDASVADVEAVLSLLAFVIQSRGDGPRAEKTWRALELRAAGANQGQIGATLGITRQAVSQRLQRAGYDEEVEGRALARQLLIKASEAADD